MVLRDLSNIHRSHTRSKEDMAITLLHPRIMATMLAPRRRQHLTAITTLRRHSKAVMVVTAPRLLSLTAIQVCSSTRCAGLELRLI
jgi:hypothetical protein